MSQVINLVPEELQFNETLKKATRLGNESVQVIRRASNLGANNHPAGSQLTFDIPMSQNNLLDSQVMASATFTVAITQNMVGADAAAREAYARGLLAGKFGFHSLALNRIIDSSSVRINGTLNVNDNPNQNLETLLYSASLKDQEDMGALALPDRAFNYSELLSNNVLALNLDGNDGRSRGYDAARITGIAYVDNAGANDVITVTMQHTEPLMCRPFQYHGNEPPFQGVNDLHVGINLTNNFVNAALAYKAADITGAVTCAVSNFQLVFRQFTPHLQKPIPTTSYWNSPQFYVNSTSAQPIAAGANATFNTNTRTYSSVPKLFAIYAEKQSRVASEPSRLYPIDELSVNFGIKHNQLKSYQADDLFRMSRKNGYNMPRSCFFGGAPSAGQEATGCVVLMRPEDVDTEMFCQSNVLKNFSFSCQAKVRNNNYAAGAGNENIILRTVAIFDNYVMYENGIYSEESANILPDQIATAEMMYVDAAHKNQVVGGSVWGWLKKVVKPLKKVVKNPLFKEASKLARNNIPIVKDYVGDNTMVGRVAKAHGYGRASGGGVVHLAGKKLSKAELLSLLE